MSTSMIWCGAVHVHPLSHEHTLPEFAKGKVNRCPDMVRVSLLILFVGVGDVLVWIKARFRAGDAAMKLKYYADAVGMWVVAFHSVVSSPSHRPMRMITAS